MSPKTTAPQGRSLTTVPPADTSDDVLADFDLPDWHATALEAFREVITVRPDLEGAELVSLEQAATLIDTATRLDERAAAASYEATGAAGQTILHPAVAESRLARTQAAAILHRLVAVVEGPRMTNSQRGRAAANARWSAPRGGRRG